MTVLSGPSGVGKSTVVARLRHQRPDIWLSVSVTTRSPRPGEVNGREYHFVSDTAFDAMVARGELLEWATFAGQKYGTPQAPVAERAAGGVPTRDQIRVHLSGNYCRCTGYQAIVDAIEAVARARAAVPLPLVGRG